MGTITEIYVVTAGDYSDYRIEAIFTDKKIADGYVEFYNSHNTYDIAQVEVWVVDKKFSVPASGKKRFRVSMRKDGNDAFVNLLPRDDNKFMETYKSGHIQAIIDAKDEKHAIKILNERRTQLIATNQWEDYLRKD